ncbi:MAG: porin family protein, partial [Paracoccaceae bacterium]
MNRILSFFILIFSIQIIPGSATANQKQDGALSTADTTGRSVAPEIIEARFLAGLRSLENGRPGRAIEAFSAILALDPTLVRVRLELARAYFAAEQWDRARREFFITLSGDLPESVRRRVLGFIRAIDARRGFDWDLSLGLTNASSGRNYDTDEIRLAFGNDILPFRLNRDTKSQLGVRATGAATYRLPLEASVASNVTSSLFVQGFFDITDAPNSTYDDYIAGVRTGLRFTGYSTTYSLAPVYSQRFLAEKHYEDQTGIEFAFEKRTASGLSVFGQVSYADVDNKFSDNRDRTLKEAQVGIRQSIRGTGAIGLSAFYEGKDVDFNLDKYDLYGVRLSGVIDVPYGLT